MPTTALPWPDDRQGRGDHQDGHPGPHQDDDRVGDQSDHASHQVLCAGQRPHSEEQCNLDACVYSDNPEIKANVDQDYIQTDPYLKVLLMIVKLIFPSNVDDLDWMVDSVVSK